MNDSCTLDIETGLKVTYYIALGLGNILTSVTLGLIIYHRQRFKRHHIFPFNIILADFITAVSLNIWEFVPLAIKNINEVMYMYLPHFMYQSCIPCDF